MLVPSIWKHPPISGLKQFLNPPFAGFSQAFPASKTPLNPEHCSMYPPIFYFITPFLNFSGVQREIERERKKNHPFLKEISGWKVKYPPFFTILGPDFVARKVPLYRRFWEHACGLSDPGVGGGGGGPGRNDEHLQHNYTKCQIVSTGNLFRL